MTEENIQIEEYSMWSKFYKNIQKKKLEKCTN